MNMKPNVTVCVSTYNHCLYIRQCLQSIVEQITDFSFDIVVGDDASSDGTKEIILEFACKYPGKITPVLHIKNIGPTQNYLSIHSKAQADYISHCDGDDYFLPGKLQKQFDFMEANPMVNVLWHRMKILTPKNILSDDTEIKYLEKNISRPMLLRAAGSLGAHSSTMYRKSSGKLIIDEGELLDYYVHVLRVGDNYAYILDDFLGVYRRGIGVSSSHRNMVALKLKHFEHFSRLFPAELTSIRIGLLKLLRRGLKQKKVYIMPIVKVFFKTFYKRH